MIEIPFWSALLITFLIGVFLGRVWELVVYVESRDGVAPVTPPVSEQGEEDRYW